MRIYIVGVSCVGKSTVGMLLAEKFGYDFVDFDLYVERSRRISNTFVTPIKRQKYNVISMKWMQNKPQTF